MSKMPVVILLFLASAVPAAPALRTARKVFPISRPVVPLLKDGFVLTGVDGALAGPDCNDAWFFELASDVNDSSTVLKAGTKLELLPSSALEKIIADAKTHPAATYRLWDGRVTKYKGKNYIFPNYFQPLIKAEKPDTPPTDEQHAADKPLAVDEPNDVLTLPPEFMEKLKARREEGASRYPSSRLGTGSTRIENQESSIGKSADTIFADRTAFLVKRDDGKLVLSPDALGRNVQKMTLRLLPCEVLELAEREQEAEPDPIRFKVAGLMTRYKGESYLLLHRAARAYSHYNFGR